MDQIRDIILKKDDELFVWRLTFGDAIFFKSNNTHILNHTTEFILPTKKFDSPLLFYFSLFFMLLGKRLI